MSDPTDLAIAAVIATLFVIIIAVGQGIAFAFGAGGKMHLFAFLMTALVIIAGLVSALAWGATHSPKPR